MKVCPKCHSALIAERTKICLTCTGDTRKRLVYIAHPYSGDEAGNIAKVREIATAIARGGQVTPFAPHLYIPALFDEATERERAMAMCLAFVARCDEVWVFGRLSPGVQAEVDHASDLRLPVRYWRTVGLECLTLRDFLEGTG